MGGNTGELAQSFIERGFKAIVAVVDLNFLDRKFAGREFDRAFLSDLPESVDPCGENGEFHSFVYAGPIFRKRVAFAAAEVALRENRFCYCDLVPTEQTFGNGKKFGIILASAARVLSQLEPAS